MQFSNLSRDIFPNLNIHYDITRIVNSITTRFDKNDNGVNRK